MKKKEDKLVQSKLSSWVPPEKKFRPYYWMPIKCKVLCSIQIRSGCKHLRKYLKIMKQIYNIKQKYSYKNLPKEEIIDLRNKAKEIIMQMQEECIFYCLNVTKELVEKGRKEAEEFYRNLCQPHVYRR